MSAPARAEVTRLEAFSDAVFAFSATLLVVSLQVPGSFPELLARLHGFVAFAIGFAALVLIWAVHNAFFRRYGLQDRTTIVLNACLLFVVLFYVYPLKYLSQGIAVSVFGIRGGGSGYLVENTDQLASLFVIYGLAFAAVFLCVALLYRHALRAAERLGLSAVQVHEARALSRHYGLFTLVGVASVLTAAAHLGLRFALPGWMYAVLGPLCAWHGAWSRRQRPGAAG